MVNWLYRAAGVNVPRHGIMQKNNQLQNSRQFLENDSSANKT